MAEVDAWLPGPRDGGPIPRDAWSAPGDAGACAFRTEDRATSACLRDDGSGVVPPGAPYDLPIRLEGCFCTHELRCEARATGAFELELTTHVCDEGADCDGCVDGIETTCALPPLEQGTWHVRVNGSDAFDLPVEPPTPGFLPVTRCWDFAPVNEAFVCPWPGEGLSSGGATDAACHAAQVFPTERAEVRIVDACAGCFQEWGACSVEVAGSEIRVAPSERACDCPVCGACLDVCVRAERVCTLPPLAPGEYQVFVSGTAGPSALLVTSAPLPGDACTPGT